MPLIHQLSDQRSCSRYDYISFVLSKQSLKLIAFQKIKQVSKLKIKTGRKTHKHSSLEHDRVFLDSKKTRLPMQRRTILQRGGQERNLKFHAPQLKLPGSLAVSFPMSGQTEQFELHANVKFKGKKKNLNNRESEALHSITDAIGHVGRICLLCATKKTK